jgi:cobalamin biosynthesis protein CobD/CbiB
VVKAKVIKDIRKIITLAERAHDHLLDNNISTARRELQRIIKLDLDEL